MKSLKEIVLLVPFQDPSVYKIILLWTGFEMMSSFNILLLSFLLFLCNPCIFVIIVFLLLFLLFINDIDSLWFASLCYVFLYCLS